MTTDSSCEDSEVLRASSELSLPLETTTAQEEASQAFLASWDPVLAHAVSTLAGQLSIARVREKIDTHLGLLDLEELKARAFHVKSVPVTALHLLAVGGSNLIFLLVLLDNTDFLARIRRPSSWILPEQVTAEFLSEIATMRFIAAHTTIPVPALLGWNESAEPVGAPYMFMERVAGVPLAVVSHLFSREAWLQVAAQTAEFEEQLVNHPLKAIGSIVDVDGTVGPPLPHQLRVPPCEAALSSSRDYLMARLREAQSHIPDDVAWREGREYYPDREADTLTRDDLHRALSRIHDHCATLTATPDVFRLTHADWHSLNVLVRSAEDPTIVAVVDWQGAQVRPYWDERYHLFVTTLFQGFSEDGVAVPEDEVIEHYMARMENEPWPESDFWLDARVIVDSDPTGVTREEVERVLEYCVASS
ncbi:Altered inheritance of mitochondria protein 9, mitochondrial [Mycena indigotica]|uniref:Altered inheritance of mitochondria protein 9, mitochondrial n=1 Tax=Mycena indigotica TaxID=2126181 RepID=A0A8H6W4V8_9AGAR|nr:Altered inheritance of mitochondria protein 9, mitochondrial [Mycena indigotica]KAF7299319.1 Altered inheritance of mitochondria protein 9, mitochondrial [Mycena indigotica]